ncbi:hypothetical protein [Paenibacillus sp. QZ-Y1]|uniref:hypothetical protein n=1 Tax=Paenibacillus sp. QZ-Y1 TaxID=3414511 RepID=UPI003F79A52E
MKKKSAFFATLSLAMATTAMTACAPPSTTQENVIPESSVIASPISNPFIEDHLISPLVIDTDNPIGDTATGGAVVQKSFTVNAGYGHLKLLMKNYSTQSVTVSLTHKYTGLLYFSREIPGKESLTWKNLENGYEQGIRGGDYMLQWSGGGSNVNGQFFGKTGSAITAVTN